MTMFYVPILKGKEAEYRSLQDLTADVRSQIVPLIELLAPKDSGKADFLIETAVNRLEKSWPAHSFMLDGDLLSQGLTSTGEHPLLRLWYRCAEKGMHFIPVTTLARSEEYQLAVHEIAHTPESQGICLRLSGNDFEGDYPAHSVSDVLDVAGVHASDTHLLVDFGPLATESAGPISLLMYAYLQSIPNLASWRTVTVAGTAFPHDMGRFKPDSVNRVPRTEWKAWSMLLAKPLSRRPQFSDYAIQHPELVDFDPKTMQISAALRYAADQEWVIVKGRGLKKSKASQMHVLCAKLIEQPEFKGADYSRGDKWIDDCAHHRVSHGNATVWRRVGTGHHLTLVARQLANIPAI
jgi:hypothetical protein